MAATVTLSEEPQGGDLPAAPQLLVALHAGGPATSLSRHLLAEVDVVEIGRGKTAQATRARGAVRRLTLALADRTVSEQHLRLTRVRGAWIAEDVGAKNRCLINGREIDEARLADGDVLELGRTVLLFRDAAVPVPGPDDARADQLATSLPGLVTMSGPLAATYQAIAAVARTALPLVLRGATGTGKEVVARAIHAASGRSGPMVAVNCGAISPQLVESELFGHRRGAFSGAVADRLGHLRAADGGTLFLDEIAELPGPAQVALLRVLQEREVVPVGDSTPVPIDVRVIVASHADLRARVADRSFRADLLARLDGLTAVLPSLAERREDLGLLTATLCARHGAAIALTMAAARALYAYDWPGNVRELDMALARAIALSRGASIEVAHLPEAVVAALGEMTATAPAASATPLPDDQALRDRLVAALTAHGGNLSAVARELGKARWQIHRWLRRFAIDPASFRGGGDPT
jgi:DNA-binding NtrC family response regulator